MSYSQDLWKEFASPGDNLLQHPWGENPDRKLHPYSRQVEDDFGDFGDFESAESQVTNIKPSMTINDPWKYAHSGPSLLDPGVHQSSSIGPREHLGHSLIDDIHSWRNEPSCNAPPKLGPEQVFPISLANAHFGAEKAEGRLFKHEVFNTPEEGDEWGDFVVNSSPLDLEPTGANKNGITRTTKGEFLTSNLPLDSFPSLKAKVSNSPSPTITVPKIPVATPTQESPPSNVPPPSILLLVIVETFHSLLLEIKDITTVTGLSKETQRQLDQESMREINHRISMTRAAARIIAGRKLRWRRDNHLSQSMKIGPANSGRAGGMKLTGIDKMENRREDGEAEEAVRTWKRHIGTLRAALTTAKIGRAHV